MFINISKEILRERLFIDIKINKIKELDKQLDIMCGHMSDEEFNNSKYVEELYNKLKGLVKED